ncbi:MAG: ABC transporter ATP-binding protein [Solirubrobacterales bacterium]|nr:ABC transporter ATP-binding protein [Solirubrobacterales bacterium]MBV9363104.1 ABC transporter ATP-binding protein [Solirubrobacterales bacterium]MBV9682442.1 ABC transporter ATP-binding protein [Solirubrobacterales bacterium]MBV9809766.1 ABC transporter ATP-binding protein [Solirubrobacterales bacterium]
MTATAAAPMLRSRGLSRYFGAVPALHGVDLEVLPGERRAILGPNGAGKSTLFNLIAGDLAPSEGTVELFGRDVTVLAVRKRARLGLGRTYQTSRVLGGLSVEDNLYLAVLGARRGHLRLLRGGSERAIRKRAREVAEQVGLADRQHAVAGSLSHGEQRQLEIGLALAPSPRLLMLDEPAAGLSRAERLSLTKMLLELDREVTLIIIEHDMDVALTVAEHVTMLHQGEKLLEGTPQEIRANKMVHDLYLGNTHGEG